MEPLRIENLFARRSIRAFTGQRLGEEQVTRLLQAAMAAPSAGNRKPWHFVAVTAEPIRVALAEAHPYARMLPQAPLCIVPCGEPGLGAADRPDFWIQDLAAATENILLAAIGMGLGAVWCGVYPMEERVAAVRAVLGIPERVIPLALVAVGYPAEEREARTQYDPQRVHRDRW
jgi:nitroreductase